MAFPLGSIAISHTSFFLRRKSTLKWYVVMERNFDSIKRTRNDKKHCIVKLSCIRSVKMEEVGTHQPHLTVPDLSWRLVERTLRRRRRHHIRTDTTARHRTTMLS
jgi:hypothetical protein